MTDLQELVAVFQQAFDDRQFSRGERKVINRIIDQDYLLSKTDREYLRSSVFSIANSAIGANPHENHRILNWLEEAYKLLLRDNDMDIFFSPDEDCTKKVIQHLNQARLKLDICMYTITDDDIARQILACHKKGVKIRLISDHDKVQAPGSDIIRFDEAGIEVRLDSHHQLMHHKFCLIDGKILITGSYNWTRGAADNMENILLTNDQKVVANFSKEFNKLWIKTKRLGGY